MRECRVEKKEGEKVCASFNSQWSLKFWSIIEVWSEREFKDEVGSTGSIMMNVSVSGGTKETVHGLLAFSIVIRSLHLVSWPAIVYATRTPLVSVVSNLNRQRQVFKAGGCALSSRLRRHHFSKRSRKTACCLSCPDLPWHRGRSNIVLSSTFSGSLTN